jgi:peptidoglycan/xylan/chitin deacetylase (PgdA/CDA1 family)
VFTVHDYQPRLPPNTVALTIDDGPDHQWTPQVLALLRKNQVKSTFSIVGVRAAKHPELVRQIVAEGHGVCNHSMTHPQPFVGLAPARIGAEIGGGLEAIYRACGVVPRVFRSPGGEWSPPVLEAAARGGMVPIDWDVDPRDWSRPGSAFITGRLLAARPGDILLCHDGGGNRAETVASLKAVLPVLKARRLQFVTL